MQPSALNSTQHTHIHINEYAHSMFSSNKPIFYATAPHLSRSSSSLGFGRQAGSHPPTHPPALASKRLRALSRTHTHTHTHKTLPLFFSFSFFSFPTQSELQLSAASRGFSARNTAAYSRPVSPFHGRLRLRCVALRCIALHYIASCLSSFFVWWLNGEPGGLWMDGRTLGLLPFLFFSFFFPSIQV